MENKRINIYGDSIMKGAVVDESFKYHYSTGNKEREYEEKFNVKIDNRSRFGITIKRGEKILEKDIAKGLKCDYALVEFGGNDCNFNWEEVSLKPDEDHKPKTDIDEFKNAYKSIIEKLKGLNIVPVLMTLPPLNAERYLDFLCRNKNNDKKQILKWLGDSQMIYRFHEMYSNAIAQVAQQTKSILFDVRREFLGKHNFLNLIGVDGIHLTQFGYETLFQAFHKFTNGFIESAPVLA